MKRIGFAASLVVVWIFLWGRLSLANVLSGTAVALVLLVAFPGDRTERDGRYVLRLGPFLRLTGYLAAQLVRSNLLLAREVLSRTSRLRTAVIAIDLQTESPVLITAIANLMALNPGTIVIELDEHSGVIYVHVFYLTDLDAIRRSVDDLQRLTIDAFTPKRVETTGTTTLRN